MSTFLTEETTQVTEAAVSTRLSSLDALESEAIHIIREVVAEFEKPALLFSGGKDSVVMLHLATKAFWPGSGSGSGSRAPCGSTPPASATSSA